jgi:hypothetical protein
VVAEAESGARLGIIDFEVVNGGPPKLRKLKL